MKSFIEENGLADEWQSCQYVSDDFPQYPAMTNAIVQAGLMTSPEIVSILAAAYNGTGPEFLPAPIRTKLDAAARPFLQAVMVHEVDFDLSDGTVGSFRSANTRLLVNCLICALYAHPWYSWRRYALIVEAWALYRACAKLGWIPWLLAYTKNTKQKGNTNE